MSASINYDYECQCGRRQSKIGISSGLPITPDNIRSFGWEDRDGKWLCPFCSDNEDKLQVAFNPTPTSKE